MSGEKNQSHATSVGCECESNSNRGTDSLVDDVMKCK